jgi:predicted ATPase/class 3 adenylate cyclase
MDLVPAPVPARVFDTAETSLGPYVPTFVVEWLRDRPAERHRAIDCTLVFADISGFTRMTELLAGRGKIGSEEMAEVINATFTSLLSAAYAYEAGLIKWGGDATLLLFHGPGHAQRGCRAAWDMQQVMRRSASVHTSRGTVRLRMSVGVHSAPTDFYLVGDDEHRELIVTGPAATELTRMEKAAGPGQIVVSDASAAALVAARERPLNTPVEEGWLLRYAPTAEAHPSALLTVDFSGVEIGVGLSPALREHVLGGGLESEHRHASVGFLRFSSVDRLRREAGPAAVLDAVERLVGGIQAAAIQHEVTFLASDIAADGGKVILSAGAPRRVGHDEDRMIAMARAAIEAASPLPLALRAGLNTGRVFAGDYGPPYRRTYSLMGDCVNLAARLAEHAAEGELLATAELVHASGGRGFDATAGAPFAAKGKRAPVVPFTLAVSGRSSELGPTAPQAALPLVGRETELAELREAARLASRGTGQVVELVGEAGMGKSRLLAEVQAFSDGEVLWAEGDIYAGARPYAPFERLLRARWDATPATPLEELTSRMRQLTSERAPHLIPWLPLIGVAAGIEVPTTPEVEQTEATLRKQRLEELTSELLGAILPGTALAGSTTLIFNDVHLMDDASCDLIARLAADTPSRRWLVVVSRRPEGASPVRGVATRAIELGPLSTRAAARLLSSATAAAPLPPYRLATLAERAAGNPLFLGELVAQLSAGGDPDALPHSVEAAIAARIDRLAAGDRRTLRAASVLGIDVEDSVLEQVLDGDEGGARGGFNGHSLSALEEFLEPAAPGVRRFSHQLVREVAYEGLPYRRRAELHARTATVIEQTAGDQPEQYAELLSLHCLHGARYEAAWRYALLAARGARSRYANTEAAESYRRALQAAAHVSATPPAELVSVDDALGMLYLEIGELGDADVAFRRGLRRIRSEPLAAAALQLRLARLREVEGRPAAAMRWAARAEATLSGHEDGEALLIRGQLAARRARISYRRGRHADARAYASTAVELAQDCQDRRTLAEALEYSDLSGVELGLPVGAGAERALAIYTELGAIGDEARVHNTLGMLAYFRGEWRRALRQYQAAEDAYARSGQRWDAATAVGNGAEILADQGRLNEAEAALQRAMAIWRGVGAVSEIGFGEYQLGRIAARRGHPEEAARYFASAREHFQATHELTEIVVVDALAAEAALLAGEPEAALAQANSTLARARSLSGVASVTPLLHRVRGAALLATGDRAQAERALRDGLSAARSRDAGHEVAFTLTALIDAGLFVDAAEEQAWRGERAGLIDALGLVDES